jgi:hypothetical protein
MPDYDAIAAKVLGGLEKAGVGMTIRRTIPGVYDPGAGSYSGPSTVDYVVTGLIQARSLYQTGAVGQNFNGVLVLTDDQFVILAASGLAIVPIAGDLLIITGVSYTIMTMIPVRPGGVDLMYRVLARK